MAVRNKPYEQFGSYILFKKLESDALGDLWRAGRIESGQLGPTVALRRLTGGRRDAVAANAQAVSQILPRITGTSFVRDQQAGVTDGVPYLAWEYAGGRSLRHIIDRARGGKDVQPNPLPLDQAIVIAEKIALSLATMADLRDTTGNRLSHGALVPQFVWISDDGEIRVAGQQLGGALIASLADAAVSADIGRYFAPEYRTSGQTQKHTDVYSMGAILFLLVTGQEPPDAATASAFMAAVRAAKTMNGANVPDDIRVILDKSFNIDPSMRYASIGEMKQAITALANSGKYSATTFNLAFYLSSLLKKEMESETADREKEAKVAIAPYLEAPKVAPPMPIAAAAAPAAAPAAAMFANAAAPKRSKAPLFAVGALAVAAIGGGAFMMLGKTGAQPSAQPVAAAQLLGKPAAAPAPRVISEPIAVNATPATAAATTSADPEAQKKAFEEAVRLRMQAEMMKLQDNFMAELKQKQSKNAPVLSAPAQPQVAQQEDAPSVTASQLDQQRRDTRAEQVADATPRVAVPVPAQQTPAVVQPQQQPAVSAPAQLQQAASVREGDVVDVASLDVVPRFTHATKPQYP
ncbi:MAG: protein kinase, partial [Acidobacteriota bacterium]|nr:protein kinase [Acidobacteriota bacterium]